MSDRLPTSGAAADAVTTTSARGLTRQDVFALLGALGAVITLVTAVMFYFGWRRSDVQAREMGIDVSLFGFSSQDYVLRSISSLYVPMIVVFASLLAWLWLHSHLSRLLRSETFAGGRSRRKAVAASRWLTIGGAVIAASSVLFTLAAGTRSRPWPVGPLARALEDDQWVVPFVLVLATLVGTHAWWIGRELSTTGAAAGLAGWQPLVAALLLGGTVALGGFWMLEEYATAVGRQYASDLSASVGGLPRATVLSPAPLGVQAPGVTEARIDSPGGAVGYRTTGLRFLARSGGKMLLLHDGWTAGSGTIIVLHDRAELVWQFSR